VTAYLIPAAFIESAEFPLWLLAFPALLGLACGSFLNVCIVRMPKGQSVVRPGSQCPQCNTPVRAWQNIPILSWLLLRGRCRACRRPISIMYPLVELAVCLWFLFCAVQFGVGYFGTGADAAMAAISYALLGWLMIGLMLMDARDGLLPDAFTLGGGLMGVLLLAAGTVSLPADAGTVYATTPEKIVLHRLGWIILVTASLLLMRWIYRLVRRREGMGLGDVKMTAMLTAFLGLRLTALAFLAACIVGTMYAAYVAMRGKSFSSNAAWANRRNAVPFGSFLAIGGLVAMVVGNQILAWYMQFLR